MLQILFLPEQDGIGLDEPALCLRYSAFEQVRIDRAFVDIEECDVIESDLMQQDDELHQICVGLLPERFLTSAKEVIQQRRDVVGKGVGIEVVVKRIVTVLGFEADFHIVAGAAMPFEDFAYTGAKISLHFNNETADAPVGVFGGGCPPEKPQRGLIWAVVQGGSRTDLCVSPRVLRHMGVCEASRPPE